MRDVPATAASKIERTANVKGGSLLGLSGHVHRQSEEAVAWLNLYIVLLDWMLILALGNGSHVTSVLGLDVFYKYGGDRI